MKTRRSLLLVVLGGVSVAFATEEPTRAATAQSSHVCVDVCTDAPDCNAECWLTQFDYDQNYPSTTCAAEGYECCGDGMCNAGAEGCNVCPDDCSAVSGCPGGGGGECNDNGDCSSGDVCNSGHQCVPPTGPQSGEHTPACGGECSSNSDCCGKDVCLGDLIGGGYCGIPKDDYCQYAPPCSGSFEGIPYSNCDFNIFCGELGAADAYCDPGIDRCMFNESGWDCVDYYENICYEY